MTKRNLQLIGLVWRKTFRSYPNWVKEELNTYLIALNGPLGYYWLLWKVLVDVKAFIWTWSIYKKASVCFMLISWFALLFSRVPTGSFLWSSQRKHCMLTKFWSHIKFLTQASRVKSSIYTHVTFGVVFRDLMHEFVLLHAHLPSFICHYHHLETSGTSPWFLHLTTQLCLFSLGIQRAVKK